ncbi:reverse transcriptase domain-containing protein [Tanacetum coccineum]
MRTRSSSNFVGDSSTNPTSTNPKHHNRRRSIQRVEPFALDETPIVTMADQHTMAELLCVPTEDYAEAIVVPPIPAEHFELKHSLINLDRFKDLLRACPHYGFTELHQLDSFYNGLNPSDQDSLNFVAGGNLLEITQDVLKIIENKSKVRNSRNKLIVSQVKTNLASVKAVEESCVTCGGAHSYRQCPATDGNTFSGYQDNIQGYVSAAAVNYNQGNTGYRPQSVANQIRPSGFAQPNVNNKQTRYNQGYNQDRGNYQGNTSYQVPIQQTQVATSSDLEKLKKTNEANIKAMQNQFINVKNELRNEMQYSIQTSMSNQPNELKNIMASFFQINIASSSGSGSLPSNTVANPRGELKAIITRSGIVLDGPSIPMPPPFINLEEDERAEETLTDPKLVEYTIKEKKQDKDEVQIHKFWQMFKQLHINITLADALIRIPKYQKMLKALFSNKEKLLELENTTLNENCSEVILKKLPEKLRDPGKFLILCGFSELKCKALADLGASINLMPLSVWKKLGLPELISTRMTIELANRSVCTPAGIARDVFVLVGRFTFPADFVIFDYESDPRVSLILGRPFLRTTHALIDVHGEELIIRDDDERLILNMKHDTSNYSNKPQRESINMIDIYNISYKDYLLFADEKITNHVSGNPTFSLEPDTLTFDLTSPEVKDDIFDPEGDIVLIEKLLNLGSTKDLPPSHNINPLSGSTTSSSPSLTTSEIHDYSLEEFADELALIESFLSRNNGMTTEDVIREIKYLLNRDPLAEYSPNNDLIYTILEMFTDEHTLDYLSPTRYDDADDDLFDLKTDNDDWGKILYDDPFDSKENEIKDSKLLIDELDSLRSSSFLPHFLASDSVINEDFSEVDALTSTDNEDKVFNPGILIHENLYEVTNRVTPDKNEKKISLSNASLILEDYNPPLSGHELPFHIEIPGSGTLL